MNINTGVWLQFQICKQQFNTRHDFLLALAAQAAVDANSHRQVKMHMVTQLMTQGLEAKSGLPVLLVRRKWTDKIIKDRFDLICIRFCNA